MADYLRESGVKWLWERIKTLLSTKQDKLVSGTNIKTINGTSVLGSGDIIVVGGGTDKHGAAYPNGKNDKPYHKVANVSCAVNAYLDTNISFYVSEYYKDKSCGILNISLRWGEYADKFSFSRIFWSLNVGINVNDFVLGWSIEDGVVTCNLYVKRTGWTSYALKRIDEQAWGNPNDLWQCYNATYPNNCYATIPDANTVVSVNEIISNTANTANKLATARTIALSGGARGETSFDGSSNVNIPVGALYDTCFAYKTLSDRNTEAKGLTLIDEVDAQFTANRLAFKRPSNILIEYSNDGGINWNTSSHTDETKVNFVSGIGANIYLGNKTTGQTIQDKLRITIFAAKNGLDFYSTWQRLYVYLGTNGATGLQCTYEYSLRDTPDNWVSQGDWKMTGWSGWNKLSNVGSNAFGGKNSSSHPFAIRLTFWFEGHSSGYENKTSACIYKVELRGITTYVNYTGCKLAETGHMYDYDWQKNVIFPAAITATKHITKGGTNQQVLLGDGSLKALSEISPITDADADILLDNHIHSINAYANGNNVNISVIESSKNGNTWETEDNDIPIPLATTTSAGVMSKEDKAKLDIIELAGSEGIYHELRITDDQEATLISTNTTGSARAFMTAYSESAENIVQYMKGSISNYAHIAANANGSTCEGGDSNQFILNAPSSSDEYPTLTLIKDNEPFIYTDNNGITSPKFIKTYGTATQILMADGSVKELSEISGDSGYSKFTDAVYNAAGNIFIPSENFFNNANWTDTPEENEAILDFMNEDAKTLYYDGEKWVEDGMAAAALHIPYATQDKAGIMSAADKQKLDALGIGAVGVPETLNCNTTYVEELADGDTLSITGFVAPTALFGNYTVHFKTSTNNSISLPSTLLWANGEQPVFEDNTCYELSITATLFGAEYVYKAVLVAFK